MYEWNCSIDIDIEFIVSYFETEIPFPICPKELLFPGIIRPPLSMIKSSSSKEKKSDPPNILNEALASMKILRASESVFIKGFKSRNSLSGQIPPLSFHYRPAER